MSSTDKIAPYAHLLGAVPDQEIAEKAGVSRTTVTRARRRQGIPAFSLTNPKPPTIKATKPEAQQGSVSPTLTLEDSQEVENGAVKGAFDEAFDASSLHTSPSSPAEAQETVVVAHDQEANKFTLLEQALLQAGFWECIAETAKAASVEPESLSVLITPDFSFFDKGSPTGTDPTLVEHLIDRLYEQGYTNVVVGATPNSQDQWLENRDVLVLADMVGYRFATDAGHFYDVVDLSEDTVPVPFPEGSALHGARLGRLWVEAHCRINFAKNKTHEEYFYALCLHNLLGVLPLRDKHYHYRVRLKPWDVCLDLLRQTPPHFNLIEAITSNHGSIGSRVPRPLETQAIIAGRNTLLTDWVGAVKMNLDPYVSPINAKALTDVGLPALQAIVGDLTPYAGWENVPPLWSETLRRVNESPALSHVMQLAASPVNRELFPFKGEMGNRLNAALSPLFANVDQNPAAFWTALGLHYSGAATLQSLDAWRTLFFKDQLHWQEVPLDLDLSQFNAPDYEAVIGYIEPLEALIQSTPADKNGLRWRYLDGSVLFKFARVFDAPFEDFVQRVDITRSIQFMKDYIGGHCVPIAWDSQRRVTYQAERNIYLPQPNYLVLYGGKVIDVAKVEYIRYEPQEQKIFWRTVKSSNDSAEFDDGSVTFAKVGEHQTLVTIVARQKFTLPLFWQAVNLDLNPPVKDFLVSDAYYTYFSDTLNNFEAKYEGREFRIGKPWNPQQGESETEGGDHSLLDFAAKAVGTVDELARRFNSEALLKRVLHPKTPTATVDAEGFSHFKAPSAKQDSHATNPNSATNPNNHQTMNLLKSFGEIAGEFLTDLSKAVRKDMGLDPKDD